MNACDKWTWFILMDRPFGKRHIRNCYNMRKCFLCLGVRFFFLLQVFRFCAFSWNKSTFGCICYVHKSSHSFRNGKSWKIWIWVLFFVLGVCSVVASVRREMCQKMSHPVTRNDENKLWLWFNVTLARLTCPSATVPTFNICFSFFSSVSCHSHSMLSAPLSLVFGRAGDINAYHTCDLF